MSTQECETLTELERVEGDNAEPIEEVPRTIESGPSDLRDLISDGITTIREMSRNEVSKGAHSAMLRMLQLFEPASHNHTTTDPQEWSESDARDIAAGHLLGLMDSIECLQERSGDEYAARLLFWELAIALVSKLPLDKLPDPDTTFTGDKTEDLIREGFWLRYYRIKMLESRIRRDNARYQEEINRFSRIRFGKSEHPDQVSADTWNGLEILAERRKDAREGRSIRMSSMS